MHLDETNRMVYFLFLLQYVFPIESFLFREVLCKSAVMAKLGKKNALHGEIRNTQERKKIYGGRFPTIVLNEPLIIFQ